MACLPNSEMMGAVYNSCRTAVSSDRNWFYYFSIFLDSKIQRFMNI